jgi:exopolysaccharide production protein ExoZ
VPHSFTLYSLQFIRFIAALLVLLFHLELSESGYKGVDIFFVISGFVMYYTAFVAERPKGYVFIINRLTKIFILYWLSILLLFVVKPYTLDLSTLNTIFLVPGHYSVIGVSWSLSYELYFYFLFAILIYLVPNKWHTPLFWIAFAILTAVAILQSIGKMQKGSILNFIFSVNLWKFTLGLLSGHLFAEFGKKLSKWLWMVIALISGLSLLVININYHDPTSHIVYGLLSFFFVCAFASYESQISFNKQLQNVFRYIGDASYAIYLFGPIIAMLMNKEDLLSKLLIIAVTIVFSLVVNQLIEQRLLKAARVKLYAIMGRQDRSKKYAPQHDQPRK